MIVHEYALLGGPNCAKVGRYLSLISSMNSFVFVRITALPFMIAGNADAGLARPEAAAGAHSFLVENYFVYRCSPLSTDGSKDAL